MTRMAKAFNEISALWRHLIFAVGIVTAVWSGTVWLLKPHMEAYAQETILEVLEAKGITPEAFAAIQSKVNEISKEQDILIKGQAELKQQSTTLTDDVGDIKQQSEDNGKLLQKLLDIQLGRGMPVH